MKRTQMLISMKKIALLAFVFMLMSTAVVVGFVRPVASEVQVGVKAGDWIKCDYTHTGWPEGTPYPEWLKVEFLSVEGTSTTVRLTMHMSDGTEENAEVPVDVVAGGEALGVSGLVIPANSKVGDSINIGGGSVGVTAAIDGEATRTYAGASRTVVYASLSQYGTDLTYYWDKQTGVTVEAATSSGSLSATAKVTETNMWETAQSAFEVQWWLWAIVAVIVVVIVAITGYLYLKRKK